MILAVLFFVGLCYAEYDTSSWQMFASYNAETDTTRYMNITLSPFDYAMQGITEDSLIKALQTEHIPDMPMNLQSLSANKTQSPKKNLAPFDPAHPPLMTDANRGVTDFRTAWGQPRVHIGGFLVNINGRNPDLDRQGISYIIDHWDRGPCLTAERINECMRFSGQTRLDCAMHYYPQYCNFAMQSQQSWQRNSVHTIQAPTTITVSRVSGVSRTQTTEVSQTMNIQTGVSFWGFSMSIGFELGVSFTDSSAWNFEETVEIQQTLSAGYRFAFWQTNSLFETFLLQIRNGQWGGTFRMNQWVTGNFHNFDDRWRINF